MLLALYDEYDALTDEQINLAIEKVVDYRHLLEITTQHLLTNR
jgi:hypothetical protein